MRKYLIRNGLIDPESNSLNPNIWVMAVFVFIVMIALSIGGFIYSADESRQSYSDMERSLHATISEKTAFLELWLNERVNDCKILAANPVIADLLDPNQNEQSTGQDLAQVGQISRLFNKTYGYDNILIANSAGVVYFESNPSNQIDKASLKNYIRVTSSTGKPVIGQFLRDTTHNQIYLPIFAPVYTDDGRLLGVVALRANPEVVLYPGLRTFAGKYPSTETFLFKGSEGNAIILSPVNDSTHAILTVLGSASQTQRPSIQYLNGARGILKGLDYSDVPVYAQVSPISGTDWFLLSKFDENEVFAEYNTRVVSYVVVSLLVVLMVAGLALFLYSNGLRAAYQRLFLAESSARRAEGELSAAIEVMNEGFITADPQGLVKQMNPMAEVLTGYSRQEALGMPLSSVFRLISPSDAAAKQDAQDTHPQGIRLLRKDGTSLPIATLVKDVPKLGTVITLQDRTAELDTINQIANSTARYQALFEMSPLPFLLFTYNDGKILQYNPSFCQLLNIAVNDLVGSCLFDLPVWQQPNALREFLNQTLSAEEPGSLNTGITLAGGKQLSVIATSTVLTFGENPTLLLILRDMTQKLADEAHEREQETLIKTIFDSAPFGIWVRDTDGRLILENHEVVRVYGSYLGTKISDFDPAGLPWPITSWMEQNKRSYKGETCEFISEEMDGEHQRIVNHIVTPIWQDGKVTGIIGFNIDITAMKQTENQLKHEREELQRSNQELEQFAYVASHDLQEPLRMITIYLQLIERLYKGKLDAKADEFIGYAVDGATTMQRLILDLLMYSRVGSKGAESKPCQSAQALEQALKNLRFRIEETHTVITHDDLPEVIADATQLSQVFQNLIGNAIKFVKDTAPQIHIGCKLEEANWHFSVSDNGIGIDPRFLERVFVIFQRLNEKDAYPGTGIGLAICKKIINRHHGEIWVESELGKGSTFHFTLPRNR